MLNKKLLDDKKKKINIYLTNKQEKLKLIKYKLK